MSRRQDQEYESARKQEPERSIPCSCRLLLPLFMTFEVLLFNNPFTFSNSQNLARIEIGDPINHTARPTHFYEIDFCTILETEMQSQIVLRYIASATTHLIYLDQIS